MSLTIECIAINKHLACIRNSNGAGQRIVANPYEATKAYVIASAEGKISKWLPHCVGVVELPEDDPELCPQGYSLGRWRLWLDDVKVRSNPELFRKLVEPLDFSKPFNEEKCKGIIAQFSAKKREAVEVDAVAIEEDRV